MKTTNDALAKYIFTTAGSEVICENFINAVLDDLKFNSIDEFLMSSPVFSATTYDAKTNLFDVKGESSNYDQFAFEIQRQNHLGLILD
ncbi:MAG: PD-(D/E)XK nuclease family transposase [Desulfovibrio sp.]|nr:PD-(D/E)XK nuclease family transposase [Desulfovibrio sp.]